MLPVFEAHGGAHALCQESYTRALLAQGHSSEHMTIWMHGNTDYGFYEAGSTCYFNASIILNTLAHLPFEKCDPVYEDDAIGVFDPLCNWDAMVQGR